MLVLHANYTADALCIWAEAASELELTRSDLPNAHPFALSGERLASITRKLGLTDSGISSLAVNLPTHDARPHPSPHLAHAEGHIAHLNGGAVRTALNRWDVECIRIHPVHACETLERIEDASDETHANLVDEASGHERGTGLHIVAGDSVRFFAAAARMARALIAEQRFVPTLVEPADSGGPLAAQWRPWFADESTAERLSALLSAMPPSARAVDDDLAQQAWSVLDRFMTAIVDASCREQLESESMIDAVADWEDGSDRQVLWLKGLLGSRHNVEAPTDAGVPMIKTVRRWISTLEDRGAQGAWRLCFRLNEPLVLDGLSDLEAPGEEVVWSVSFHLQFAENHQLIVDAEDVWSLHAESATVEGVRIEAPQELLLAELGRAARLFPALERALEDPSPIDVDLSTRHAYEFLREVRPLLIEQGFGVVVPEWWETPGARVGARLRLDAPDLDALQSPGASAPGGVNTPMLGLNALVSYEWQMAIGDTPLTLAEFEQLAAQRAPLIRVSGRWVEVRPEDIRAALHFIHEHPGGEISVAHALRLAYGWESRRAGVPILGLDATGWVGAFLDASSTDAAMPVVEPPDTFTGSLRPYQQRGLSWLTFLDRFGLGPCLADDMGLGKTIQLLALLLHERSLAAKGIGEPVGPTLLVVPMSIVGNWKREAERFSPSLHVHIHHGADRAVSDRFFDLASRADLVITTYALAHRDRETLERVGWHRVVLDEAQNIKNPAAKQTQAIRALDAPRRVALTGTPLENRLTELWSIMEFCNPGFLGSLAEFKRAFSLPIERYRDRQRAAELRSLVRPFVLRRLKSDPNVITDLPEKVETKEFCRLTSEQVELYETCVAQMLGEVEQSEGIRRRGIVLTALTRLKQICNHPTLVNLDDDAVGDETPAVASRSGKCIRLLEMLDEVLASGEQALIFTQFRQMGRRLASMLRHSLDREVLFLHGGTPAGQRQQLIDRFQRADGSAPVFILSLKAGGVGLNLTAASHVFHFDRWWNPAVENQATDRAYRIGQTRTVHVHKFIVAGTLEDRIDQMIESKIALAEDVIGAGEDWLTELSTAQLRDMLTLRADALGDDEEDRIP